LSEDRRLLIDRIYARALELERDEREVYLRQACLDDEIRHEVERLVDAALTAPEKLDERIDAIRESFWAGVLKGEAEPEEDLSGKRMGRWRIEDRIARGGLATVYSAQRDDGEFVQKAAFKVLRRGLDTDDVVARFRAERQILSTLDHPAIAKILDGGALPDGRPYLVLEYVDGEPITTHCEHHNVDVRGRVELMLTVLHALHHAHKHTVVHRDIKPSNILVSSEGNVVLLDFGIAKLLDPEAMPGSSTLTRTGVSLLTPGYGSPEQRAGQPVTTASDIYQAGLVLYELLSGERPDFARGAGDVPAPSERLKGMQRHTEVRGDLDAIVTKAMHADPSRRYGSASEMADDLERYLEGRPVAARPDTLAYRAGKLLKRRPWVLPGTLVLVVAIAGYLVTLTLYSARLSREQQRAEAAQAFMVDLMSSADPYAPADPERGRDITVVEALGLGVKRLESELSDQPELKAALLGSIAHVYASLDQTAEAIDLAERALALNLELYGERSDAVLDNLRLLAQSHTAAGEYDKASALVTRQLDDARAMYSSSDPRLGLAEVAAGAFSKSQGDLEGGLALLTSGIDKLRAEPDEYAEPLIAAIVGSTDQDGMNDERASLPLLEEALAVAESKFGENSLYAARVRLGIGRDALYAGDVARSEKNYSQALGIFEELLGPRHNDTIAALQDYAVQMNVTGRHAEAEAVYRRLVDPLVELNGENHRTVADNYQNLATTITYQGRYDESLPLHRKAYEIYKSALDTDHYIIAFPLLSIASIELERHNSEEAYAAANEALERFRATVPETYLEGVALCLVGLALEQEGDTHQGSALVEQSHALILKREALVPKYTELCRVPSAAH
jgi:tetratricopeptide (TPR) repeat protein/tRNA A-37 threonylcarbamoyl transferase component Bud32